MKAIRHSKPADEWSKTIVAFPSPHKLKELCISQGNAQTGVQNTELDPQKFKIRLASDENRVQSASLLVQKMYSWRGYQSGQMDQDPNRITLLAFDIDKIVGTLSLGLDSSVGLLVDELYKPEVDSLRAQGRQVCEIIKLALDKRLGSKPVLAALFHISFIYGHNIHQGTDFVIEVNPRHVGFYRRMLGFELLGEERTCNRVNAPAVLLRLDLSYAAQQIEKLGGLAQKPPGEKSLYPHGFSKLEEERITQRLLHGTDNRSGLRSKPLRLVNAF
ncbi:MAG: hypothetical protein V4563_09940 [Pseudomonadota bacterium]